MKLLRFVLRLVLVLPWIVLGLLCVGLAYPLLGIRSRAWLNRHWSRCLMAFCGLQVIIKGEPRLTGPVLLVANHVSWIDIFVLNSARATSFVAKSEIRSWPVIGWLVAGAGTLFIERGQRHAVHAMGEAMQARFKQGDAVGLFPEGTTSEGFELLPFHASLFEPARAAVDQQFATGARQELFFQHIVVAGVRERQLHARARAGLAARRQVGDLAGAVALQESRADGRRHRALAGLVRPHEQVQAVFQAVQHQRLAELAEFFQGDARELHFAPPGTALSRWNLSSSRKASPATADCAGSACKACNCAATSPT